MSCKICGKQIRMKARRHSGGNRTSGYCRNCEIDLGVIQKYETRVTDGISKENQA